jgi:hypothetical protein
VPETPDNLLDVTRAKMDFPALKKAVVAANRTITSS